MIPWKCEEIRVVEVQSVPASQPDGAEVPNQGWQEKHQSAVEVASLHGGDGDKPSVPVLPPSLAVTVTYLPISPSRQWGKAGSHRSWERGKISMREALQEHRRIGLNFPGFEFYFFPLIWTTSDLLKQMPINFQISTNHATEFPAFSIKYFQSWNPFDWRSNGEIWEMFECEWPLGKMFGQWIKAEEREERGEKLLLLSSCLYQPFLHPSSILWSTTCSNLNLENAERLPINPNFDQIFFFFWPPPYFYFLHFDIVGSEKKQKERVDSRRSTCCPLRVADFFFHLWHIQGLFWGWGRSEVL